MENEAKKLPYRVFENMFLKCGLDIFDFINKEKIIKEDFDVWKAQGEVPIWVFKKAKTYIRNRDCKDKNILYQKDNAQEDYLITEEDLKKVEVAFWGKDFNAMECIQRAKSGEKEFLIPMLQNLYYKDVAKIIGIDIVKKFAKQYQKELGANRAYVYANLF